MEEYIKHGEENALTGAWMKELENASARVHISRLDALKIQLQQQAELLYSNQLDALDAAARQTYTGSFYHTAYEIQRGLGVGWTMQAINESAIQKVLSRPWTTDGQTFRDRCWTNKQSLVNSVNTQLTQMIVRGESADRAISAISKQFEVSRSKAGRLVMTESAYFSSAAQKDCFTSLGVERYVLVASFDHDTCELCGALDGKVFKMSEYQGGGHGSAVSSLVPVLHGPILRGHGGHRRTLGAERGRHHRQGPGRNHLRGMEERAYKIGGCSAERTWYNGLSRTGGRAKKGAPIGLDTAITGANPNFSSAQGYRVNCQRCVQTFELRRRGYNVIAKPKPRSGNQIFWGSECFVDAAGQPTSYTFNLTEAAVKRELAAAPDGARYGIYIKWKGRPPTAHVFIAEKSGGVVRYLDPQNGNMDASGYFARGSKGHFGFFRMDDKQITTDQGIISATVEVKKP